MRNTGPVGGNQLDFESYRVTCPLKHDHVYR